MKKSIIVFMVVVVMIALTLMAPTPAVAVDKGENLPFVGILAGIIEAPVSAVKNIANCKGWVDCLNIPKHIAKGALNGAERIVGTSTLGFAGKYDRDMGKNGVLANNKFISNGVGWAGVGLGLYYTLPHTAAYSIFNWSEASSLVVTGAAVGETIAAVDVITSGKVNDE